MVSAPGTAGYGFKPAAPGWEPDDALALEAVEDVASVEADGPPPALPLLLGLLDTPAPSVFLAVLLLLPVAPLTLPALLSSAAASNAEGGSGKDVTPLEASTAELPGGVVVAVSALRAGCGVGGAGEEEGEALLPREALLEDARSRGNSEEWFQVAARVPFTTGVPYIHFVCVRATSRRSYMAK